MTSQIFIKNLILKQKYYEDREILKNEFESFVMYPEKTPIIEAYRASEQLKTVGIETQMVVANLIISEEQATTPFFRNRRNMQEKYLKEINDNFKNSELVRVPIYLDVLPLVI